MFARRAKRTVESRLRRPPRLKQTGPAWRRPLRSAGAGARIGRVRRRSLGGGECRLFRDHDLLLGDRRSLRRRVARQARVGAVAPASSARSGRSGRFAEPVARLELLVALGWRGGWPVAVAAGDMRRPGCRRRATCGWLLRRSLAQHAQYRCIGAPGSQRTATQTDRGLVAATGTGGAGEIVHGGLRGGDRDGGKLCLGGVARVERVRTVPASPAGSNVAVGRTVGRTGRQGRFEPPSTRLATARESVRPSLAVSGWRSCTCMPSMSLPGGKHGHGIIGTSMNIRLSRRHCENAPPSCAPAGPKNGQRALDHEG